MAESITKEMVAELLAKVEADENVLKYMVDTVTTFALEWDTMDIGKKQTTVYNILTQASVMQFQMAIVYSDFDSAYAAVKDKIEAMKRRLADIEKKGQPPAVATPASEALQP